VVSVVVVLTSGCSSSGGTSGECAGSVRYRGVVYRSHNALNQDVPRGRLLGSGEIIGCGGVSADRVATVEVYAVKGVREAVAVMTTDRQWHGIYVINGLARKSWPAELKR
jgi:hypothetical protein